MRGQGVGDLLVSAVFEWARDVGLNQVLLSVKENNSHAEALYVRNGFERLGTAIHDGEFDMSARF